MKNYLNAALIALPLAFAGCEIPQPKAPVATTTVYKLPNFESEIVTGKPGFEYRENVQGHVPNVKPVSNDMYSAFLVMNGQTESQLPYKSHLENVLKTRKAAEEQIQRAGARIADAPAKAQAIALGQALLSRIDAYMTGFNETVESSAYATLAAPGMSMRVNGQVKSATQEIVSVPVKRWLETDATAASKVKAYMDALAKPLTEAETELSAQLTAYKAFVETHAAKP